MPDEVSTPGVYSRETPGGLRRVTGVPTSIAAFVGHTAQGPTDRPIRISGFADFRQHFGDLHPDSPLSHAVSHFFQNGGATAWTVRVAARDRATDGALPSALEILGSRADRTGLFALEEVDLFNILNLPRISDPGVLSIAIAYAEERRSMILIDMPDNVASVDQARAWITDPANGGLRHRNAVTYWPRINAADPLHGDEPGSFAASGAMAGLYARTDATRGVWKAPAGAEARLIGVQGLEHALSDQENAVLNPLGVNCLRMLPNLGPVAWGARTMAGADALAGEWKYVSVRRLALFIEESLHRGTQWVASEPNDETLWAGIRLCVDSFMDDLFRQGAFQGAAPREAYMVKCDATTTTRADIDLGVVNFLVGFAPLKPAEFTILRIRQPAAGARAGGEGALVPRAVTAGRPAPYGNVGLTEVAVRKQAPHGLDGLAERIVSTAGWGDPLLPREQEAQLRALADHFREASRSRGAMALFTGPPGSGRTRAAEVLARALGRDLYRIDLGRVVSKYVGETEKNLARIFAAAEDAGAILLFDEADALFGKRSQVRDRHDRHAGLAAGALLQHLEARRALVILTSNEGPAPEGALARRLRAVIAFPFRPAPARPEDPGL